MSKPALQLGLEHGADALALALTNTQISRLLSYLALLEKWGRVYNLTAVRAPMEMLSRHLLDCLAVIGPLRQRLAQSGLLQGACLLDVGSGAGFPGVVIAICCPEIAVDCVDAVAKKAAFVRQAAVNLQLPNLRGLHHRAETLTGDYAVVVSRAFASLSDFTSVSSNALAKGGIWMAMKGKHPADEILALPDKVAVFHVEQLFVPGLDAQRCLVWLGRSTEV